MSVQPQQDLSKTGNCYCRREEILKRIAEKRAMGIQAKRACKDEGISRPTYYLWLKKQRESAA